MLKSGCKNLWVVFFFGMLSLFLSSTCKADVESVCGRLKELVKQGKDITKTQEYQSLKNEGTAALSQLVALALDKKKEADLRHVALHLLKNLGNLETTQSVLPLLMERDESFPVRNEVLQMVLAFQHPEAAEILILMLEKQVDQGFTIWVHFAALKVPSSHKAFDRLFALLQHEDHNVRMRAIRFFLVHSHPEATRRLRPLALDNYPEVRAWAVMALASQGHPATISVLESALKDPSPMVRSRAIIGFANPAYEKKMSTARMVAIFQKEKESYMKSLKQSDELTQKIVQAESEKKDARELKKLKLENMHLKRQLGDEINLLVSLILKMPRFQDTEEHTDLKMLISLLRDGEHQIAYSAFLALETIGAERIQKSPLYAECVKSLVRYFATLPDKKWLWRSVDKLLQALTGENPGDSAEQWLRWLQNRHVK